MAFDLTKCQPDQLNDLLNKKLAEMSLSEFLKQSWRYFDPGNYSHNWHIDAISEHLMAVNVGQIRNLIINIPPRHMKSLSVAVAWPAWTWAQQRDPDFPLLGPAVRWMFASYAQSLSHRDSLKMRRLIESGWYQKNWGDHAKITGDLDRKERYETTVGGYRLATSVGGALTGEGGDIIVCFPPWEVVWTDIGPMQFMDVVKRRYQGKVWSYSAKNGMELCQIIGWHTNPSRPLVVVEFENCPPLVCTEDHRILTEEGMLVAVGRLKPGTLILDPLLKREGLKGSKIFKGLRPWDHPPKPTYCITVEKNHNMLVGRSLLIAANCDDPLNANDANSDVLRQGVLTWWDESMQSRLNDPKTGAKVIIMQRLHEDDLTGHILQNDRNGEWCHLMLPAEYDSSRHCFTSIGWEDPRTEDGEALWEERVGTKELNTLKAAMGPYAFAGQYQQSPQPRGGGIIKREWWNPWPGEDELREGVNTSFPPFEYVVASLDTAFTEDEENDYSALTIWGVFRDMGSKFVAPRLVTDVNDRGETILMPQEEQPKVMLVYGWQKRLTLHGPPEKKPDGVSQEEWDSPAWRGYRRENWGLVEWTIDSCRRYKVDRLLIEGKASGLSVVQELRRLYANERFSLEITNPGRMSKVARAYAVEPLFANGQVYAPYLMLKNGVICSRSWCDQIITQFTQFPKATHDDLVDSSLHALQHLRDIGMALRKEEVEAEWDDSLLIRASERPLYDV